MKKFDIGGLSGFVALVALGTATCGSDGPPATAEPGSKFCELAQQARDVGDAIDTSAGDPDLLQEQVGAALEASKKAAAAAPKDFEVRANESVQAQEAFIDILAKYDYVFVSAITSDEGQELFEDPQYIALQDERKAYLLDKCEIVSTDDTSGEIPLSAGDDGIRQLFELLQLNESFNLTDDQIDCAVETLSGNISDEDIQAIANSEAVSDQATALFGQTIVDCGIELPSS